MYTLKESKYKKNEFTINYGKSFVLDIKFDDISKVIIYDSKLINGYITQKFEKKYKYFLTIFYDLYNNQSGSSDFYILLDEINKYKILFAKKYQKELTTLRYSSFIKKILILEDEIKKQIFLIDMNKRGR